MPLPERLRGIAEILRPWRQELKWAAICLLGLVSLLLGYLGIHTYLTSHGESAGFWTVVYNDLQLLVLEPGTREGDLPWQLDVARIAVPAVTALAGIMAITVLLRDDLALFRARAAKDHVIVCGLGRRGLRLTRSLLARGDRVVVIEADAENDRIGTAQRGRSARRGRVGVVIGDAADPEVLRRAGIGRASRLISVCSEDGVNAAVAAAARELAKGRRRGRSLACMIHIFDQELCELMRGELIGAAEAIPFRLDVFNTFEDGARAMLLENPISLEGGPEHPHVVVVGLGWLGDPLVAEIARSWREQGLGRHGPLAVTLVDSQAEERTRSLLLRHPWIEEVCALRSAPITVGLSDFESGEFLDGDRGPARLRPHPPADGVLAYVCLDDATDSLDAALILRKRTGGRARIVVRTETDKGLGALLDRRRADGASDIAAFPLLDRVCDAESVIGFTFTELLAREMHADFREREAHDPSDPSMQPWETLDEELRESNRDAARDVGRKLAVLGCQPYPLHGQGPPDFGFTGREIELLARMEHERWIADQQRNGWEPGPVRDQKGRISPYLIPFDDLPPEVQDYDRDAVRDLPRILARIGYGIDRGGAAR